MEVHRNCLSTNTAKIVFTIRRVDCITIEKHFRSRTVNWSKLWHQMLDITHVQKFSYWFLEQRRGHLRLLPLNQKQLLFLLCIPDSSKDKSRSTHTLHPRPQTSQETHQLIFYQGVFAQQCYNPDLERVYCQNWDNRQVVVDSLCCLKNVNYPCSN